MAQVERSGLQQVKWLTKNISTGSFWFKKAPRAAAYLRSAVEDEEYIAGQLAEIQRYLEDRGWELACTYLDNGYSGNTNQRPALLWLQRDIQDGRVDVVVVCDLTRLSRSFSRLQHFLRLLRQHQVRLVCLQ